jgi:nucleoside-diphosphate-sugar epimerase
MCEFYSRLGRTKHYVIRHSNIYGPYDKFDLLNSHVFGATVNKIYNQDSDITIWGDGSEERDLLYISDLVDSVKKIIESSNQNPFFILNIGSGKSISVKKLTTMILSISGVKNKRIKYDNSKPSVKTSVSLDCSKAKSLLGWSQKVSIEEGIKKTISWYKEINNITTSNSK